MPARAREGLPKSYRLLQPSAFTSVLRRGCKKRDGYFTVLVVRNTLAHLRVGLVVSRKVSSRAVVRNRIKRQIRESVRHHQPELKGLDLVVIAQPQAARAEASALRASLRQHWISIIEKCGKP
ncbi:MAG: ribonuclease P protein component [Acidiferrobacterales bacterium]